MQELCFDEISEIARSKRIARIERILYEHDGVLSEDDGPLELHFDDGTVLHLASAGDGERLKATKQEWKDPFQGPLSEENARFITESGKWTRVDVSERPPYSEMIGLTIELVEPLKNDFGTFSGVSLTTTSRKLFFVAEFDESHVYWTAPPRFSLPGSDHTPH